MAHVFSAFGSRNNTYGDNSSHSFRNEKTYEYVRSVGRVRRFAVKKVENRKKSNVAVKIAVIILGALLIAYSLSIILVLLWGLLSSLKSENDFMNNLLGLPTINNPEWFDRINDPDSSYKTLFWLENYVLVIRRFNFPASTSFFVGNREVTHTTENNFFGMLFNSVVYAFGNGFVQAIIPAIMAYMCAK